MIKDWRIGFAPADWRRLHDYLLKEGCSEDEMERAGLVKRAGGSSADIAEKPLASVAADIATSAGTNTAGATATSASRRYDAFRGRIMFPIRDSASRVIAFSGRILPRLDDGKTGKYINSPETILFNKSETLYGFDRAKLVIRQKDAAILVEGQMDLLMAHGAGYENTVASSGTAVTLQQLVRIKRLSENLLLSFDSDTAGIRASERAIRLALSLGMNVKVIAIAGGKDPAELILHDPSAWEKAVREAKHVIEFLLESLLRSSEGRARALAIEKTLLPLLRLLSSTVEQSHFLKVIAEKSGLREESIWEAFKKIPAPAQGKPDAEVKPQRSLRSQMLVRRVFSILFLAESRNDAAHTERVQTALVRIFGEEALKKRSDYFVPMKDVLLSEAESYYGDNAPSLQEEQELLRHLEEEHITVLLSETMDALSIAEREGKKEESQSLLGRCKELTQKLGSLKSARFSPL